MGDDEQSRRYAFQKYQISITNQYGQGENSVAFDGST